MPVRRLPTFAAVLLWLCCAAYTWPFVTRGWIAHDEGTIAQSAERVLHGQVPHRDFDEVYTGGLTYLHAGAMRLSGVNLRASRFMLFGVFMGFVAAASWIARRLAGSWGTVIVVALVVVWSAPNYFVSLPSWYTLFLATLGLAALLRFIDTGRRGWVLLAGLCGGLSVLMKITGVYYLAAGLLFLAYVEQSAVIAAGAIVAAPRSRFWPVVAVPAGLSLALLGSRLWPSSGIDLLQLLLPPTAIVALIVWREWMLGRGVLSARARALARLVVPFLAGAALPVAAFVCWYWTQGGVPDLLQGVFVLPQRRLMDASLAPPAVATVGLAVPFGLLLLFGRHGLRRERVLAAVLVVLLGMALYEAHVPLVYRAIWAVARSMPLVAVVALIGMLIGKGGGRDEARAVLFVIAAAFMALVQLPYATPTYFCYAAPVTVLAMSALVAWQEHGPRMVHAVVAVFFVGFAAVFVNQSYGWNLGVQFLPYHPDSLLDIDRGGLRVSGEDARTYRELVGALRAHVPDGTIVAGPDCPEVYFLSGFPNPTRAIFDFLSPVREDEAWIEALLARTPIHAAVINTMPEFSKPFDPAVTARLEQRFPSSVTIGRFVVRFAGSNEDPPRPVPGRGSNSSREGLGHTVLTYLPVSHK